MKSGSSSIRAWAQAAMALPRQKPMISGRMKKRSTPAIPHRLGVGLIDRALRRRTGAVGPALSRGLSGSASRAALPPCSGAELRTELPDVPGCLQQWDALVKSTAILCSAYVIFVNRVGFEDGLGFWGGSRVVTPRGEIEYRLDNFKEDILSVDLNNRLHTVEKWIAKKD